MDVKTSVLERYSAGARETETALCCPADYDIALLRLLPPEIIEKDYGCGDPSRYVREGDTVLDLGSGGGKICYMAAQLIGNTGRVIGVDMNDAMLALARKYQSEMANKLGGDRVCFLKGYIQDLALDVCALDDYLKAHPVRTAEDLIKLKVWQDTQRRMHPLIPDRSVDLVISNCVLNLVEDRDKQQVVQEIYRVLRPGGRIAIADIVSDEPVPARLKTDPKLWSGCIAGAFQEQEFLKVWVNAGFAAVKLDKWDTKPWQTVEGIEFRSVTVTAMKSDGKECIDRGHAVLYRGPYHEVRDEEGHVFPRGERIAVCERTFRLITEGPYKEDFIGIEPLIPQEPVAWCTPPGTSRPVQVSKGGRQIVSDCKNASCC